jgi:HEPN domain-containing protein
MEFVRDPNHWLRKLSPDEWIRAALGELRRAEQSYQSRDARAGLAGARRAAGMALNGALIVKPNDAWGRSYADHLLALAKEESIPDSVRAGCKLLMETQPPGGPVISLRTPALDDRILEAARDVIAHAFAVVKKHEKPVD